jgi:NAD(P)H-quinone oxidoreductase subunit K
MTSDHEMNLVFSKNTGEYLNKTPANVIPPSKKEKITELPEDTEKAEIIDTLED